MSGSGMKPPEVIKFVKTFDTIADVLNVVSKVLEVLINMLRFTAFVGIFGGFALQSYMEQIKPVVDKLADTCDELSTDVFKSIVEYLDGDVAAANELHKS